MKTVQKMIATISAVVVGSLCTISATALVPRDIAAYLYKVEEWEYAPIRPAEGNFVNNY